MTTTLQAQAWQVQEQLKELRHRKSCFTRVNWAEYKTVSNPQELKNKCTCDYSQRFERLNNAAQSLMAFKMKQEKFERMERAVEVFCSQARSIVVKYNHNKEDDLSQCRELITKSLVELEPLISKLKTEEGPKDEQDTDDSQLRLTALKQIVEHYEKHYKIPQNFKQYRIAKKSLERVSTSNLKIKPDPLDKYRHDLYFPIELKYEKRGSRYAYFTTSEDILMDLEDQGASAMMFLVLLLGKLETGEYALVSNKRHKT